MKKRLVTLALAALMVLTLVAPLALAATWTAYVAPSNGGTLNLRSYADKDAPILLRIPFASSVTILDKVGSTWMKVDYKGHQGYVMQRYLSYSKPSKPSPKPPAPKPAEPSIASLFNGFAKTSYFATLRPTVPGGFAHMRWAPTTKAGIIRDFYQGDTLEVIAQNNSWAQLRDPDSGVTGFMLLSLITDVGFGGQGGGAAQ